MAELMNEGIGKIRSSVRWRVDGMSKKEGELEEEYQVTREEEEEGRKSRSRRTRWRKRMKRK